MERSLRRCDGITGRAALTGCPDAFFKSIDGGNTWNAINTGLTSTYINTLVIDPQVPTTIYVGTDMGLFKMEQSLQQ